MVRSTPVIPALCAALAAAWLMLCPAPARASVDLSLICDRVAVEASEASGVPLSVLKAIALTETGRRRDGAFRPWPWTVNMEGKGSFHSSRDEALALVYEHFKRGARSFDVGCFQINYRWHGQHFDSIEAMFDPRGNAMYAARFLRELHAELGSWDKAAGAYHSRTPEHANRYRATYQTHRARFLHEDDGAVPVLPALEDLLPDEPAPAPLRPRRERVNNYPLFLAAGGGTMGSLIAVNEADEIPMVALVAAPAGGSMGSLFAGGRTAAPLFGAEPVPEDMP
jgi:hypothetical protein